MTQRSRRTFSPGMAFAALASAGFACLLLSCNDAGTSPYAPHISYKIPGISAKVGVAIVTDTLVSDSGALGGSFSIIPSLPAGLALNAKTGFISGTPTALDSAERYTVTANGANGAATASVNICVGNDTTFCNTQSPQVGYGLFGPTKQGPGFLWTTQNVPLPADTPLSTAGIVTSYSVTPSLPSGIALNSVTGVISGTPTDTSAAKDYKIAAKGPFGVDTETVYLGVYPSTYPTVLLAYGEARFEGVCTSCHGIDGKGGFGPTYYHSDFIAADRLRPLRIQMQGLPNFIDTATTISVNGTTYENEHMDAQPASDSDIAGTLTFIRAMFIGATDYIGVTEATQQRSSMKATCVQINNPAVCDTGSFGSN